jgi:hypothetical protein
LKGAIVIVLLLLARQKLLAQQPLVGKVMNSRDSSIVPDASIKISKYGNDTLFSIANSKGVFYYSAHDGETITFSITAIGFNKSELKKNIDKSDKDTLFIYLITVEKILEEVKLKSFVSPITIKEDTIEYKVDSFSYRKNATTEDLLKTLPGIFVDKQGNITAQGKVVTRVTVNGRDFFGGDTRLVTTNMPAEIIDKVQVIDDYGVKSSWSGLKSFESAKVINLQLKKDKQRGYFGGSELGLGSIDRRTVNASFNLFSDYTQLSILSNSTNIITNTSSTIINNQDIKERMSAYQESQLPGENSRGSANSTMGFGGGRSGINSLSTSGVNIRSDFKKRNGTIYGSYLYSIFRNTKESELNSQYFIDGKVSIINYDTIKSKNVNFLHQLFLNYESAADSFNLIKLSFSGNHQKISANSEINNLGHNLISGLKIFSRQERETTPMNVITFFSANWLKKSKAKKGRFLSLLAQYNSASLNLANSYYLNRVIILPGLSANDRVLANSQNNDQQFNVYFQYTNPLSAKTFLEYDITSSAYFGLLDRKAYRIDTTGSKIAIPGFISSMKAWSLKNRIGVNYLFRSKKLNYGFGLFFESKEYKNSLDKIDTAYSFFRIAPNAEISYSLSRTQKISFRYYGSPSFPVNTQIQPVNEYASNILSVIQGNYSLSPEYNHAFHLIYNSTNMATGKLLFTNLFFGHTFNKIVSWTIQNQSSLSNKMMYENFDGKNNFSIQGFYSYTFPVLNRKFVFNIFGLQSLVHSGAYTDSSRIINYNKSILFAQNINTEMHLIANTIFTIGLSADYTKVKYSGSSKYVIENSSCNFSTELRYEKETIINFSVRTDYYRTRGLHLSNSSFFI